MQVHISNAGLIILGAFLPQFFERLEMVKNGSFVNSQSQNRAVYILQYLANGDINFPEYHLVLNKILVGLNSDDYLEPFDKLTDIEKEMCTSLMNGLRENWKGLQQSSIEEIQQSFFNREGLLEQQLDNLLLRLSRTGVDVLLDRIPWNISLIKCPWMNHELHIEW